MTRALVVTGGSVGIGEAVAARFREDGDEVVAVSRRPCPVDGVTSVEADLVEVAGIEAAAAAIRDALGEAPRPVCLVHNAAMMLSDAADRIDASAMERAMRLNVLAPALLTAALRPHMAEGSSVIFIGSTLSEQAVPGRLSYVTTKHAILGLMRSTVQDFFGQGIHSVAVCPGFTDTAMLREVLDANPGLEEALSAMVSFGRLLTPKEIADVVHFAARNPSLNGAVLHANLGQRQA